MADDDDVAEDWEDVDTEVRKWLTKNPIKWGQPLFMVQCFIY